MEPHAMILDMAEDDGADDAGPRSDDRPAEPQSLAGEMQRPSPQDWLRQAH